MLHPSINPLNKVVNQLECCNNTVTNYITLLVCNWFQQCPSFSHSHQHPSINHMRHPWYIFGSLHQHYISKIKSFFYPLFLIPSLHSIGTHTYTIYDTSHKIFPWLKLFNHLCLSCIYYLALKIPKVVCEFITHKNFLPSTSSSAFCIMSRTISDNCSLPINFKTAFILQDCIHFV